VHMRSALLRASKKKEDQRKSPYHSNYEKRMGRIRDDAQDLMDFVAFDYRGKIGFIFFPTA